MAGRFVPVPALVVERPLLESFQQGDGAEDRVRLVLPRVRAIHERRVERGASVDRELVEGLPRLDPPLAKVGRLGAQAEARPRRVVEEISRSDFLAQVPLALELVHRLLADLARDDVQVHAPREIDLRITKRLGRDHERRHRALVVHHRVADEEVALGPPPVEVRTIRVSHDQVEVASDRGVHVGVEGERRPRAAPGQLREDVEAVLEHADALRTEALPVEPGVDGVSDRALPARRALDVGEVQDEVDELLLVDQGEHGRRLLRVEAHANPGGRARS